VFFINSLAKLLTNADRCKLLLLIKRNRPISDASDSTKIAQIEGKRKKVDEKFGQFKKR
jgi:hypothetical protein